MKTEPSVHNSSGTCLNLMKVNNKRHLEINIKNNQRGICRGKVYRVLSIGGGKRKINFTY